ncbi:hypothetical protein [Aestuariivirga sp.]|uniref:hypothetical protein n=1 Tax=Aestuariivirga sp. TaxID=2650926 RepID=UPI0035933135
MTSDPFTKGLKADLTPSNPPPKGYKLVTPAEVGMHLPPDDPRRHRKIALKFDSSPEGFEAFERQTQRTHERVETEGGATLILVMEGHPIGTKTHRERLQAWREGKLPLPSLADYLGIKALTPAGHASRASVQRSETSEQLVQRLERQREEKRTGVRLEAAPRNPTFSR